MYESFYGLTAKPFQLKPDPNFFFGSKGHKRAMAYLEYGLSQGDGFIVITGEVGAGKTTLMRNLFRQLEKEKIVAAQIVNTHVGSDDILRLVISAFGIECHDENKATLLTRLEKFLRDCDRQGLRALLVVDEAQNLSPDAVEELRMLSNFQTDERSLLQTFLLGQPEFRKTMLSENMKQLLQRVIASYHLGPLDLTDTRSYIEHRLHTVGWTTNPVISAEAFSAIYNYTGGIPRKINALCDRLFLMGYLEEYHGFGAPEVAQVIADIRQETTIPLEASTLSHIDAASSDLQEAATMDIEKVDARLNKMERSLVHVISALKKILPLAQALQTSEGEN
jgi:putative secretion ATPase (PEP-CTERM system associated)